jgi:hypothetical protein
MLSNFVKRYWLIYIGMLRWNGDGMAARYPALPRTGVGNVYSHDIMLPSSLNRLMIFKAGEYGLLVGNHSDECGRRQGAITSRVEEERQLAAGLIGIPGGASG